VECAGTHTYEELKEIEGRPRCWHSYSAWSPSQPVPTSEYELIVPPSGLSNPDVPYLPQYKSSGRTGVSVSVHMSPKLRSKTSSSFLPPILRPPNSHHLYSICPILLRTSRVNFGRSNSTSAIKLSQAEFTNCASEGLQRQARAEHDAHGQAVPCREGRAARELSILVCPRASYFPPAPSSIASPCACTLAPSSPAGSLPDAIASPEGASSISPASAPER